MERRQPKRKAWHIVLEIGLSVLFFGVCMLAWLYFRPTVLKTVFADALPSAVPTQGPFETPNAVAFAAYEDERILFAEGTPIPTPVPTPTPSPEPTPVPTKNPASGDTLYAGDRAPIVIDVAIRLMQLDYLDFEQPTDEYTEGTASEGEAVVFKTESSSASRPGGNGTNDGQPPEMPNSASIRQ